MNDADVLTELVGRYSPSGRERPAVRAFVRIARALGYRARIDRAGNGVAERGRGRPLLLFLGHIDTVPGDRGVRRARGRIHGRGAVDAKGPLASALVAGSTFAGPGTLRLVAAVGEETDSRGARALLRGPRPDAVIVGEPSGSGGVTLAYKGDLRLEVTFVARRTHWASPEPTAVDTALVWLDRLRGALAPHRHDSPFRSLTGKVVGASADPDADPQIVRWTVDLRVPPGLSCAQVAALLPAEPRPTRVRTLVRAEPVERDRSDPVVRALVGGIRTLGETPTLLRKSGTSDLNVVAPVWGVPAAAYGPGDARLDHTDREVVSVRELARATAVLRRAFETLGTSGDLTLPRSVAVP